jgi:hypothetical protein
MSHNDINGQEMSPPPSSYSLIHKDKHQHHAPLSPDRTATETVESSDWSVEGDGLIGGHSRGEREGDRGDDDHTSFADYATPLKKTIIAPLTFWSAKCLFNPYDIFWTCLECFGMGGMIRSGPGVGNDHTKDCFVRVDSSTADYWSGSNFYPYIPVDQTDGGDHIMTAQVEEEEEEVKEEGQEEEDHLIPIEQQLQHHRQNQHQYQPTIINKLAQKIMWCRVTYPPPQVRQLRYFNQKKFTPISDHTKSSKYDAFSSLNTLHRRNDHYSVSFFTSETLDAIHTSPMEDVSTPRQNENGISPGQNLLDYKTPPNRTRVDSDTFRRTIKVVTCEKRDRDEISPIPMDTPRFTPRRNEQQQHQCADENTASNRTPHRVNLFGEEDMVAGAKSASITEAKRSLDDMENLDKVENDQGGDHESAKHNDEEDSADMELRLWPDTYLQKSPTFTKALRKAGRKGKCLFQGWVAFRLPSVPWNEIIRSPRRCDFQYIVLLDDMPLLHIFPPRPKTKRMQPKKNVLDNCMTFDLSNNSLAIEVQLASQELGNEVWIVDAETRSRHCSLLPIEMYVNVFLDSHKSRLAKSNVLKTVFESSYKQNLSSYLVPNVDEHEKTVIDPRQYMKQVYASTEQYDVSRHLMFVLDSAIQFPLPRKQKQGGSDR